VKQKVVYFNDSAKAVCVHVDTRYQEDTIVLQPLETGVFWIELEESDAVFIHRWNRAVLIGRYVNGATQDIKGRRPSSQKNF